MQDQPLYQDVQREIAMKLLKLRVEFYEDTRPIVEGSKLDASILNQFKVPFRVIAPSSGENKVFLLKGNKNMNLDTE